MNHSVCLCPMWAIYKDQPIKDRRCLYIHLGAAVRCTLDGCCIDIAQNVTDLGVEIDCNLKYDTHTNNIIGKAYAQVGVLFKGFASRNLRILRQAFITYVRPILEYASSVWSP